MIIKEGKYTVFEIFFNAGPKSKINPSRDCVEMHTTADTWRKEILKITTMEHHQYHIAERVDRKLTVARTVNVVR